MGQYVTIDVSWETPEFYCPVCGSEVFSKYGQATTKPCAHLLFSHISGVGEFYNSDDVVKNLLADDNVASIPWDLTFVNALPEDAVVFGFESAEIGCGLVEMTVTHGIRFPQVNGE